MHVFLWTSICNEEILHCNKERGRGRRLPESAKSAEIEKQKLTVVVTEKAERNGGGRAALQGRIKK